MCSVAAEFVTRQPVLGNAPLKLALAQMRFPRQLGLSEADARPIQKGLAQRYPQPSVGRTAELVLKPAGVSSSGETEPVFQFRADDQTWTVTLTPNSVSLETTSYLDFADFAARWAELLGVVDDALSLVRQERIGLRYINELPCDPSPGPDDIRRLVREELVGAVGAHPRTGRLLSSMHEQRFAQDPGVCTLRYGLVRKQPNEAAYVLDMDFYDEQQRDFDLDTQMRLLGGFNDGAYDLFKWAMPLELFATFDPQEPNDA